MIGARSLLKKIFFIGLSLAIGGYAGFELRNSLIGPTLIISNPLPGHTLPSSVTTITGTAKNVSFLYLNGRQIYTNESGIFEETVLLPQGYNVLSLEAIGRFNKKIVRTVTVLSP